MFANDLRLNLVGVDLKMLGQKKIRIIRP